MNKLFLILLGLSTFLVGSLYAQQPLELKLSRRGEAFISIDKAEIEKIRNIPAISYDKIDNGRVKLYINKLQYDYLQRLDVAFIPEVAPSDLYKAKMAKNIAELKNWDAYPSYNTYLETLESFVTNYPDICMIDTIGYSIDNRLILSVKISDNVEHDETEPEFFYTSSMHGDELVGYVLTLRFIDYILTNRENDQIKQIIENVELYINPLANPDGTFRDDNSTVNGATRGNKNGVDLNRNFPDPKGGDHPDGREWQVETEAMMDYMKVRNFVMSMNFHGGAEVINYPWDTFHKRHADDQWFQMVCREYADLVHEYDDAYLTDLNDGITNGYDWYSVEGGRQDYVTYFLNGREVIAEVSAVKLPDASTLPYYWEANYKSMLKYVEQLFYGLSGRVSNHLGEPVSCKVSIPDYDVDNSCVYANNDGVFYRFLKAGSYNLKFETTGYEPITIQNVNIEDYARTEVFVEFTEQVNVSQEPFDEIVVYPNPANEQLLVRLKHSEQLIQSLEIVNGLGQTVLVLNNFTNSELSVPVSNLPNGVYVLLVKSGTNMYTQQIIIER